MNAYTELEIAILEAIQRGNNDWSWFEIARYLGGAYEGVSRLIYVLQELEQRGLVEEIQDKSRINKAWRITTAGLSVLDSQKSD